MSITILNTLPNISLALGTNYVYQIIATGPSLQYQWYKDGIIMPGEISDNLIFSSLQITNGGSYYVHVYNMTDSVNSNSATLTVTTIMPQILNQQVSFKSLAGYYASLFVTTNLTYNQYQWYKNGLPIAGAIYEYLRFSPLTMNNTGTYFVKVYNSAGFINSDFITVDVYDLPRVVKQPDGYYKVGLNGQLRICPTVYGGSFQYQWQKDGIDISGQITESLIISNAEYEHTGIYRLRAINPIGTVFTDYFTIYVLPVPQTCFPFETPAGGLAGGGNLASGLTDMKIGRAQECYITSVLPMAKGNNCCLTAGPQISPYAGGTTSGALLQKQMEAQALCNISTNIAVAKLKQYIKPCPVISSDGVDLRFMKYQRRGPIAAPMPPPPGVFIPNNPAIPKATDGYCVPIIGITQSRF